MEIVRLINIDGRLYFPHGGARWDTMEFDLKDEPNILIRQYDAGDCDTIPWPLKTSEDRENLAIALFNERECNFFFPYSIIVELPDGEVFDFDSMVL